MKNLTSVTCAHVNSDKKFSLTSILIRLSNFSMFFFCKNYPQGVFPSFSFIENLVGNRIGLTSKCLSFDLLAITIFDFS